VLAWWWWWWRPEECGDAEAEAEEMSESAANEALLEEAEEARLLPLVLPPVLVLALALVQMQEGAGRGALGPWCWWQGGEGEGEGGGPR